MSDTRQALQAVAARELVTVARSRAALVLFVAVTVAVVGIAVTGSSGPRYLPTTVDLLLPMEVLVPAVAIAFGYRTIAADARRGELDVLETYPLSIRGYVVGVFLGRLLTLVVVLGIPLAVVGVLLAVTPTDTPSILTAQRGVDSPLVFVRFVVLTLLYALVVLAMALAASALARSRRSALVLAIVVLGFVVVGLDLLILRGFVDGVVGADRLTTVLALSPTSAYRGLVFETVISTAVDTELRQAVPLLNVLGLLLWTGLSFVVTTVALSSR